MTFQVKIMAAICALSALMVQANANAAVEPASVKADAHSADTGTSERTPENQIQNQLSQKVLQGLNLNEAIIKALAQDAPTLQFQKHSGLAYHYKTAAAIAKAKPQHPDQLILDTEVKNFDFKTDVETVKDHFQKRHNLSYSIVFRVINQQQQILFEQEQNFDAVYNSYVAYDNDPQAIPSIVDQWIKDKVQLTINDISKSIAKVLPAAVVTDVQTNIAYATPAAAKVEQNQSQQQKYILFQPVKIMQHPKEDRLMRLPGKVLSYAKLKASDEQKNEGQVNERHKDVFELSKDVTNDTQDQLYIIPTGS